MPSPSESTATSDATPIVTPSVERKVRSGFSRSVARPTRSAVEAGADMGRRGVGEEGAGPTRTRPTRFQGAGSCAVRGEPRISADLHGSIGYNGKLLSPVLLVRGASCLVSSRAKRGIFSPALRAGHGAGREDPSS